MKNKLNTLFMTLITLFVVSQIPISILTSNNFLSPIEKISWKRLINGSYGQEIEDSFKEQSYISRVSSGNYRELVYGLFSKTNNNVIVGKKDFLFLKEKIIDFDLNETENIPKIVSHIKNVERILESSGVNLFIITIPARSRIYPELAYESEAFPKNRTVFYQELFSELDQAGIKNMNLELLMKKAKKELYPTPVFFKVDHHWSYKAVEYISPFLAKELAKTFEEVKLAPKLIYSNEWEIRTNAHSKISNKLGFPKASLPNKFKQEQSIPVFSINKHNQEQNAQDRLIVASSSYARYGLIEFLSNQLGYPIPFYIERGRSPNYAMAKVLRRNITLSQKYGMPHTVLWVVSESELKRTDTILDLDTVANINNLKNINFTIKDILEATQNGSKLSHSSGSLGFKLELEGPRSKFVLALKVTSNSRTSTLSIGSKKFEIIHDGETNYFPVELSSSRKTIDVSIYTPPKANIENGRTFEIIGVFKEE